MRVLVVSLAAAIAAVPLSARSQEGIAPAAPAAAATPAPVPAPAPPPVHWKAQAKAGLVATGGNAQTTTLTAGANVSRADAANKFALEGVVAYGESGVLAVRDGGNGVTDAGEEYRRYQITMNNWMLKARYDRSLSATQGLFVAGSFGADEVAGKTVIGGGQVGWVAKLLKTATQELVAELGYDFTHEEYALAGSKAVEIHSGRAFLGETLKLSSTAGLVASVEALANLNEEDAPSSRNPAKKVQAWEDVRVNGRLAVSAALRSNVSLSVGYTVRWDRNPAPQPAISGAPPLAPGYFPFAKAVDTVTDAALIVSFL